MTKKILLLILICILGFSTVIAQKFNYIYNGVTFKCKVEGQGVCIVGFDVKANNVVIPAYVSNAGVTYPVKKVSTFLNGNNYLATSLVLEEGIEDIDKFAFNEFRKLQTATLPSTIKHIGRNAFRMNSGLVINTQQNIDMASLQAGNEQYVRDGNVVTNIISTPLLGAVGVLSSIASQKKSKKDSQQETLVAQNNSQQLEQEKQQQVKKPSKQKEQPSNQSPVLEKKDADVLLADIDTNIPSGTAKGANDTYCIIIANEKYIDVPEVEFAAHDGEIFREYCIKTLGIPEKQIKTFLNASFTDMKRALNWMNNMAKATSGKAKMILYYAGHGLPSEQDNSAYLIPTDGFPKDITTCFQLSEMYSQLGKMPAQSITVFLDACFSGVKRGEGSALIASRGVAVKAKKENLTGNLVVFSAASDDETAYSYKEKGHGMFTYFLLKKLQESKGETAFGELFESISSNVMKGSMLENDKLQTPSISTSASMKDKWKTLSF